MKMRLPVLHCELNGDCQEPDERHSERSHVSSELHSCQAENDYEVFQVQAGWDPMLLR